MNSDNFIVYDTLLGSDLETIKNNKPLIYKPLVVTTTKTLGINEFIQALVNGLTVDTTTGSVIITTPSAQEIISALGNQQNITCYLTSNFVDQNSSSPNTVTINCGSGVVVQNDLPSFAFNTNSVGPSLVIVYSLSPAKVVLS
jgi:hypothetical protein